jgi:hypothetical protein
MVYEGQRFKCEGRLAGKLYGGRFGIDVGFADAITVEPDLVEGSSFLDFAGAQRTTMRIYPRVTHVAEKLHAYTLPRERENTRVKDLPDLALLAALGAMDGAELRQAIRGHGHLPQDARGAQHGPEATTELGASVRPHGGRR